MPTQIFFDKIGKRKLVSDFANSRFIYANINENKWHQYKPASLGRVHAATYDPSSGRYYAVDTSSNALVSFNTLDNPNSEFSSVTQVGDIPLGRRPHDIAYNDKDGFIYVLLNSGLLRFQSSDIQGQFKKVGFISKSNLKEQLILTDNGKRFSVGYMRALSIVEGEIFLINSTLGNVIQIPEFDKPESWAVYFNQARGNKYAEKGSFDQDGLILNDVEYFNGWWYGSNYYAIEKNNYLSDKSISKYKLIRWKSWQDFEDSKWQDLSLYVHPESIPYYFSKYKNKLFIAMFHNGNEAGEGSGIFEIKPSRFCVWQ